jgi:hypothetical protein
VRVRGAAQVLAQAGAPTGGVVALSWRTTALENRGSKEQLWLPLRG